MKTNLIIYASALLLSVSSMNSLKAQGTWTPLNNVSPHVSEGGLLLLSDGSVLVKTYTGDSIYGNVYDRLTPDIHGSYVNGTWTSIAPMHNSRLFYSTQLLTDGRVYVAGGEYGTGSFSGETYDPLTNVWTIIPWAGGPMGDANSEILPDGKVLQAVAGVFLNTIIYNPLTNSYTTGPLTLGNNNESAWVKLPDNSVLFVDRDSRNSERYIPSQNQWIADALTPDSLYEISETGAAILLPDGRAFFLGGAGHTAYYKPSGSTSPGTWDAGPNYPNGQAAIDAPAAMMTNGKILCTVSPFRSFYPTSFYEFDYLTNSFTRINAPNGDTVLYANTTYGNMLDLPDGTVLFSYGSNNYYVYSPGGTPLASGKPTISQITQNSSSLFTITGTLFNGISEGAGYGDDWQMASNYPIIRLTSGNNVYYTRTAHWNSTGVRRGNTPDTTQFTLPSGLPVGTYSLVVTANGISSNPTTFSTEPLYTGNIKGSPFCSGSQLSVPYTTYGGSYFSGNVFTAQLSDANGSFASPVAIGSISSTTSGTISATLPSIASGLGYRIRVVSSNPAVTGTTSPTVITIVQSVTAGVSISAFLPGSGPICFNASVTFTATPVNGGSNPSYQWKKNSINVGTGNTYTNASWFYHDTVKCILTSNAQCATGNPATSNSIIVNSTACSRLSHHGESNDPAAYNPDAIVIYPNPTEGKITLQFNSEAVDNFTVKVIDVTGRVLINEKVYSTEGINVHEMDLNKMTKGMYIMILENANFKEVKRIILE